MSSLPKIYFFYNFGNDFYVSELLNIPWWLNKHGIFG